MFILRNRETGLYLKNWYERTGYHFWRVAHNRTEMYTPNVRKSKIYRSERGLRKSLGSIIDTENLEIVSLADLLGD